MKRGKRFFENENLLIYVGTAIFFILAIALGIIMYMLTNATPDINEEIIADEQSRREDTENVATEIGKTVEEQTNKTEDTDSEISEKNESAESNTTNSAIEDDETNTTETNTSTVDEPDLPTPSEPEQPSTEVKKEVTFIKPTDGEVICEYAKDNLIYSETLKEWITHTAIDIKADKTSVIKSSADGIVRSIINDPRYGLTVIIDQDDGYETVYSNLLTAEFVVEGEEVTQGQTIGTAGNTASFESSMPSHLHFELLRDGEYLDPSIYLK